jgi:hypothetical protein
MIFSRPDLRRLRLMSGVVGFGMKPERSFHRFRATPRLKILVASEQQQD